MTRRGGRGLRSTCFHEAGHAIVATALGIPITSIRVSPEPFEVKGFGGPVLGIVRFDAEWPVFNDRARERAHVATHISVALSGPLAQGLYLGHSVEDDMSEGGDGWAANTFAEMLYFQPSKRHDFVNRQRAKTLELLAQPEIWAAVQVLASVLVERRRLSAIAAYRVIRDSWSGF